MLVVQTHGMGVDSSAWLVAVLTGALPFEHDLADLTVVTAMTGDESVATRAAMNDHMLPLMERRSVRYVQVARRSLSDEDGIVVLADTAAGDPYVMVMRGPVALSDEMSAAGTIPQQSNRTCSHKWKGWVLDGWLGKEFGSTPRLHVVGFAAEETRRRDKDEGYSNAKPGKTPWYPLIDHGWDRERCLQFLWDVFGFEWPRSCCSFCPFQAGRDAARMVARWRAEPAQVRQAVALEYNARSLNPRMLLFGKKSAEEIARAAGLGWAADEAIASLVDQPAELYEVRRIYRRMGDRRGPDGTGWVLGPDPSAQAKDVWRSLRPIAAGSRMEMIAALFAQAGPRGGELDLDGPPRLVLRQAGLPLPSVEHYLAVGPVGLAKQRSSFEELWEWVLPMQPAVRPRQLALFAAGASS